MLVLVGYEYAPEPSTDLVIPMSWPFWTPVYEIISLSRSAYPGFVAPTDTFSKVANPEVFAILIGPESEFP